MALPHRLEQLLSNLSHLDLQGHIISRQPHAQGLGGSCDVFCAWSQKHNKHVAVKRLRANLRMEHSFAKKIVKEIRIWAALLHPNVLPFLGFFVEGESMIPSLISEWMINGTLNHYMKNISKGGILARIILRGIASGLVYLHSRRVIHADMKSSNVLISRNGIPLLADFGLSLALTQTQSIQRSNSSGISAKGTVRWMSAELLSLDLNNDEPSRKPDERSDVWAFGMVIYELLSQKTPYWNISNDAMVVVTINNGILPNKPESGPSPSIFNSLWSLACICWLKESQRPIAQQILEHLSASVDSPLDHLRPSIKTLTKTPRGARSSLQLSDVPSSTSTGVATVYGSSTSPGARSNSYREPQYFVGTTEGNKSLRAPILTQKWVRIESPTKPAMNAHNAPRIPSLPLATPLSPEMVAPKSDIQVITNPTSFVHPQGSRHSVTTVSPSSQKPVLSESDVLWVVRSRVNGRMFDYLVKRVAYTVECGTGRPASSNSLVPKSAEEFPVFVQNVLRRADVSVSVIIGALTYVERARPHLRIAVEEWALHRVFLGALIIASKYLNDSSLKNAQWSYCTRIFGRRDIARVEREFLDVLNWELAVSGKDVADCASLLVAAGCVDFVIGSV